MAKEKKSSNSKKSNDSATKAKTEGLASLLKSKVSKLVGAGGSDADISSKEAKKVAKASSTERGAKKSASTAKAVIEAPSALTKAGSESKEAVPAAVAAAAAMNLAATAVAVDDAEVVLTDAEGRRYCRATDCDQIGMVDGYCRYHYLYYWKKIQNRKKILADGKLERYIEELTARYTDKFIELLRKDLRTEKDFLAAVQELELDDSASASAQDEDEAKTYLEEISGVASESSARDDEGY